MDFYTHCPPRIVTERKRLGMSQTEVATKVGVSREQWGNYERGKAVPGADVLLAFSAEGADIHYIMTGFRSQLDVDTGENTALQPPTGRDSVNAEAPMDLSPGTSFESIMSRVKEATGASSWSALSRELGLTTTALSNRRKSGSVPFKEVLDLSQRKGLDFGWLITGGMSKTTADTALLIPQRLEQCLDELDNEDIQELCRLAERKVRLKRLEERLEARLAKLSEHIES